MKTVTLARLLMTAFVVMGPAPAWAQGDSTMNAVVQRLEQLERQNAELRDRLEQQNAELREQVGQLRQELDRFKQTGPEGTPATAARIDALEEKVDLHDGRLSEQEQVKAQSSQRVPIRLTGALLFSLFRNSENGVLAAQDYPVAARTDSAPALWGATLRRSIIGVEFQTPEAVFGGQFRGSLMTDLTEAGDAFTNIQPRLRTAGIEGRWNGFAIFAGHDKPIFSVRDPTSLAQVQFAPLTAAGNFWLYRPQVRVEQTVHLGQRREFRARIGVSHAPETGGGHSAGIPCDARAPPAGARRAFPGRLSDGR
jgi:hypothetical protein